MYIRIKDKTQTEGITHSIDCEMSMLIQGVIDKLHGTKFPEYDIDQMILVSGGKHLKPNSTVGDNQLSEDKEIDLYFSHQKIKSEGCECRIL